MVFGVWEDKRLKQKKHRIDPFINIPKIKFKEKENRNKIARKIIIIEKGII